MAHMEEDALLQDLEQLAAELDIEVRYDVMDRRGGLCRLHGRSCLILNRALSMAERIDLLEQTLCHFPLHDIFLRPWIRERLEQRLNDPS